MTWTDPDEGRCRWVIEGPRDRHSNKVWWRRNCKRRAMPGTDRCWQHAHPEDLRKAGR